ncbi:MAG: helix-turn-helix domain-containing protein [Muribaculaceae bacterium]|nr:helix-turn-helix domain-containing protein [Muribaculaceae bacterium]
MTDIASIPCFKRSLSRLVMVITTMLFILQPARSDTVDSLYHVYSDASWKDKVEIFNKMSQRLHDNKIIDSLYHCGLSTRHNTVDAMTHYLMAEHYYSMEQFQQALIEAKLAIPEILINDKPDRLQSNLLNLLSDIQFRTGDFDEALKTRLEAYKIARILNDEELISSNLGALAEIYLVVELPAPGLKHITEAIAIERKLNRKEGIATRLGTASELYLLNNEPDRAMAAINEAYDIDLKDGREEMAACRLVQKGAILEYQSQLNEARNTIAKALPILEQSALTYTLATAYNHLGGIEKKLGNTQDAIAYYKKALEQSIKCGSNKLELTAERGLWETMRENDPAVALLHLERYAALNDSMRSEMESIKLKVFETTNQDSEQTQLDQKNKRYHQLLNWGGIALVVMLLGMLTAIFFSWRQARKSLKMYRQIQELKSHFFTNITNKLETPLNVLMSAGQHLIDGGKNNASENKRLGELIVNHGQSMLNLVNQLLDIERVKDAIELPEYKRGDIVMFVRMLVENFSETANQRRINLDFQSPFNSMTVMFAPIYIRKIVHGLVNSAFKYTSRNDSITVRLTFPETGRMQLVISDTGKGIPVEERYRLFEPFSQSVNDDDGVNTALELSLVKQLVQAMNGSIEVESELGRGTTFTIDFPTMTDEGKDNADGDTQQFTERHLLPQNDGNINNRLPLVFIVESNEDVAFFIASHLSEKYNLRFALDGREALQNAQNMVPDLIITNVKMPVLDGKKLIMLVRENPSLSHIPIIAMTSDPSERERISCIEAGADAVLVKPIMSQELRLMAAHLIGQRLALREHFTKASDTISSEKSAPPMNKEDKEFFNKLIDIIHANMGNDDINIEHIASALSMSTKQLRSRVTAITGMTPVAFVLQVRLNYARHMITNENVSLTAIASRCGFQNLSHFSKAFKQQFGISPLQYRKKADDINNTQGKNQ